MRRRTPATSERPEPPRWTVNYVAGAVYATELTGSQDRAVWLPALRKARYEWCQANGCHRAGTKTCVEVFGARCREPYRATG